MRKILAGGEMKILSFPNLVFCTVDCGHKDVGVFLHRNRIIRVCERKIGSGQFSMNPLNLFGRRTRRKPQNRIRGLALDNGFFKRIKGPTNWFEFRTMMFWISRVSRHDIGFRGSLGSVLGSFGCLGFPRLLFWRGRFFWWWRRSAGCGFLWFFLFISSVSGFWFSGSASFLMPEIIRCRTRLLGCCSFSGLGFRFLLGNSVAVPFPFSPNLIGKQMIEPRTKPSKENSPSSGGYEQRNGIFQPEP